MVRLQYWITNTGKQIPNMLAIKKQSNLQAIFRAAGLGLFLPGILPYCLPRDLL